MDGPDGGSYYWGDKDTFIVKDNRNFGGGSLMIHLTVSYDGPIILNEIKGRIDSEKYIELLEERVLSIIDLHYSRSSFIWQQGNASIHVSKSSREFFEKQHINVLDWPARSPDLNIVENMFSYISRRVYSDNREFSSPNELWDEISDGVTNIPKEYIDSLYNSVGKRFCEVLLGQGRATEY